MGEILLGRDQMIGFEFRDETSFEDLLSGLPEQAAHEVYAAITAPERFYHAAWHLGRMWRLHRQLGPASDELMRWAIAYHDIVYTPQGAPGNEIESAEVFLRAARRHSLPALMVAEIAQMIVQSAAHLSAQPTALGQWFLDLDLEPLAVEAPHFAHNTALLRREFSYVEDAAYEAGRQKFLSAFQAAPVVYRSPYAPKAWHFQMRTNLAS